MEHPFYYLGRLSRASSGERLARAAALGLVALAALFLLPDLGTTAIWVLLAAAFVLVTVKSAVEIVGPYEKRALTVLGDLQGLLGPGIHLIPPFVSETHIYDLRTQTLDVPPQEAITQDNSPVTADAVIFIRVTDAEKAYLEVEDYETAVSNLAQTTLRAVLGDMDLDETLSNQDEINARINDELDRPTDEWGVEVEAVEVQQVMPSRTVVSAMEQQTAAERRRRAMILEAQGERRSAVERAQGERAANVVRAEGEKQAQILEAQGDAVSTVLRAKSAESMGERAVIEKGMETLDAIGQGESTTFVLPQELSSLVGRYGKHLTGSDVGDAGADDILDSQDFDAETEELLGLDDVTELVEGLDGADAVRDRDDATPASAADPEFAEESDPVEEN